MMPRLGAKYPVEIEVTAKPQAEYLTDDYFELDLPVAPAVMVANEIVAEGSDVAERTVAACICRHLGLPEPAPERKGVWGHSLVKMAALLLFIAGSLYLVRYSPAQQYFTADTLNAFLASSGFWAPLVFVFVYAIGVCLFIPGTLLTAIGAAVFGAYWGFVYVWVGAMLGAGLAFLIGRYLGRDFAASLIGDRLQRYDDAVARNGFATVLYLRLVYFPFTPMNFGMGLTRVRFGEYLLGTGLGIVVGTFVFTFFIGTLKEIWADGQWSQLLQWKVFLSIGLFVCSLFIPTLIKRMRHYQHP
jgi:uncharacterized membrane protein YdjX (TVP38/TMEM64 family)